KAQAQADRDQIRRRDRSAVRRSAGMIVYIGLLCWGLVYLTAAARPSPRGRRWPRAHTAWFLAALLLAAAIYGPGPIAAHEDDPAVHVILHMLAMMAIAPLLAFAAPITLLLRTLPIRARKAVVRELNDPAFRP